MTGAGPRALPDFPWDRLVPYAQQARQHPDGIVDLSVGTPVDPSPQVARDALAAAADAHGYPLTAGTEQLRTAIREWAARRLGATGELAVLPTIGSKELVALLPSLLGLRADDTVVIPSLAYPTYAVGALLAGARPMAADGLLELGPQPVQMVWVNSPANPTGRVLPPEHLRKLVDWSRERGAVLVSDECYLDFGWDADPVSVLHPDVCGGSYDGLIAVHSLSKRSNMAGYRAGFLAGDQALIQPLLEVRKHAGLIVPAPIQAAMVAALGDEEHVQQQRARYAARRETLQSALTSAGFRIDHSEAGLYVWATRDEDCWDTVRALSEVGVLVAPGEFYGAAGRRHVRVALIATDERVDRVAERLTG